MIPIHIVGHAGSGKTTLIVEIVKALVKKDIKVGTMKHSAHIHELDKPGKDSFRHRTAGASPACMITENMSAIYLPGNDEIPPEKLLEKYFSEVQMVFIEGWISGPYQKIEVWRREIKRNPLFHDIEDVKALISDDVIDSKDVQAVKKGGISLFRRADVNRIVDFILTLGRAQK